MSPSFFKENDMHAYQRLKSVHVCAYVRMRFNRLEHVCCIFQPIVDGVSG